MHSLRLESSPSHQIAWERFHLVFDRAHHSMQLAASNASR